MSAYRVVQWATGNIGSRSLRGVIEHPDMTLVGLYVYSPDKVGRDAGELSGSGGPTGVLATHSIDEILALGADCVLYMPQECNFDEVCRLLESGANVVTTRGEFQYPPGLEQSVRARIDAACRRGGTSIHGTGSSPGFISEAVPLVLTSIQRRLDSLSIEEFADLSRRNSPVLLFDLMGFGKDPARVRPRPVGPRRAQLRTVPPAGRRRARPSPGLGGSERRGGDGRPDDRDRRRDDRGRHGCGATAARAGAAERESPSSTSSATWYCTTDLDPAWDLRATGWRLFVAGDAPLDVEMRLAVPLEDMGEWSPGYTANRAVNAVPVVCAAEPGIRTTVDLPQIIARLGERAGR